MTDGTIMNGMRKVMLIQKIAMDNLHERFKELIVAISTLLVDLRQHREMKAIPPFALPMDCSSHNTHVAALTACTRHLSLLSPPETERLSCSNAHEYLEWYYAYLGRRLLEAGRLYLRSYPGGCSDVNVWMEWVMGMRAELTLGNMIWRDPSKSSLAKFCPVASLSVTYCFFFDPDHAGNPALIAMDWNPVIEALAPCPEFERSTSNPFMKLHHWYVSPHLNQGVTLFLAQARLTWDSMKWVLLGGVPETFRPNVAEHPSTMFPWEEGLMTQQWRNLYPQPPHSAHIEMDRILSEIEAFLPRSANFVAFKGVRISYERPSKVLSRAWWLDKNLYQPKLTDGVQMHRLQRLLFLKNVQLDVLLARYLEAWEVLVQLFEDLKKYREMRARLSC
ncbi:hypothetical protein JAAARDRAFT_43951 [Jaapia argillacea MUCL 33604]|uniref:Uncharacterized protein n=1 Tax=Jaapia argillacea MUCL 33604 TaxID=933084 RepID=A0A067QE45_9AGAM|nr:hypothetical protein JAAARDRAFT_43951 [Jaapia argillacea MUCL 33604]